jgi:hypothetical protein
MKWLNKIRIAFIVLYKMPDTRIKQSGEVYTAEYRPYYLYGDRWHNIGRYESLDLAKKAIDDFRLKKQKEIIEEDNKRVRYIDYP